MSGKDQQKNKPANTLFKQQRLASWQPIMSPPHVCACFAIVAAIFIPIGAAIYSANQKVENIEVRYDHRGCTSGPGYSRTFNFLNGAGQPGSTTFGCARKVNITLDKTLQPPIYLYYGLRNFYQNHRSYAKSRNENQLAGDDVTSPSSLADAQPLRNPGENILSKQLGTERTLSVNGNTKKYGEMVYDPAGLVAWSMFNDTFEFYYWNRTTDTDALICDGANFWKSDNTKKPTPTLTTGYSYFPDEAKSTMYSTWNMPCHKKGIAWTSDVDTKFKKPTLTNNQWTARRDLYFLSGTNTTLPASPTAAWNATYRPTSGDSFFENGWYAGEAGHDVPVVTDEDLMVWMRTAALPNFRKLYRVIDVELPAGTYSFEIFDQYNVTSFNGEKFVALATVSWVGGKNSFLGEAYIAVGALAVVAGLIFMAVHKILGDRTQRAIDSLSELT